MKLYQRDYFKKPNELEIKEYEQIIEKEKDGKRMGRVNKSFLYPEAIRHYNSLFPNNHICLIDWKRTGRMNELTERFSGIVHHSDSTERDILNYINHTPAYFIIASLLLYTRFGHHEAYLFPEFSIGNGKYYADYLIVGKNSGGYEFLFVELESPNQRITIKNGHDGQAIRSGLNQIVDWKYKIEADFKSLTNEFEKLCIDKEKLPSEFREYDSTRMHFAVIAGMREDYEPSTYHNRRARDKEQGIDLYHYDNLIDLSRELEERNSF